MENKAFPEEIWDNTSQIQFIDPDGDIWVPEDEKDAKIVSGKLPNLKISNDKASGEIKVLDFQDLLNSEQGMTTEFVQAKEDLNLFSSVTEINWDDLSSTKEEIKQPEIKTIEPVAEIKNTPSTLNRKAADILRDYSTSRNLEGVCMPRYELDLKNIPSKGIFYPKDARIFYFEYSEDEIHTFSLNEEINFVESFVKILSGITCVGFDILDLKADDFFFVGMLRKARSLIGEKVIFSKTCTICKGENKYEYGYDSFETNDISYSSEDIPIKETFNFAKMENGEYSEYSKEFIFSSLTVGQTLEMLENKVEDENIYDLACIQNETLENLQNIFSKTSYANKSKLKNIVNKLDGSFKLKVEKCNTPKGKDQSIKCNAPITFGIDAHALILPYRF